MKALKGTSMVALVIALFFTPYMAVAQCYTIGCRAFSQSAGGGAPSIVQSQSTGTTAGQTTLSLTTPVTAGNILVAVIYGGTTATSTLSFTDSFSNTPTTLASTGLTTDLDTVAVVCAPITTGGTDTLSFLDSGAGANVQAVVYEVHTTHGTCTQDVTAVHSNTAGATACSSGPMTTTTANDLLIGVCGLDGTITSGSVAAGSGWSGGLNAGTTPHPALMMSEYRIATSPGSFTATSGTIPSEEQATLLVALKP
jgi:hypothetical protein